MLDILFFFEEKTKDYIINTANIDFSNNAEHKFIAKYN